MVDHHAVSLILFVHSTQAIGIPRLCVHRNTTDASLLATVDTHHAPPSTVFDLQAYVDLYYAAEEWHVWQASHPSKYSFSDYPSVYTPISFVRNVIIDGHRFPTLDEVEQHLGYFYGPKYMRPDIATTS